MASAPQKMLDLVLENFDLDEVIEISSDIFIDEEKDWLISREYNFSFFWRREWRDHRNTKSCVYWWRLC